MSQDQLSVRELTRGDIELIASYWINADRSFLEGMGVDVSKLPSREQFTSYLLNQIETPLSSKESYCLIWLMNGEPIGHCNTRPTVFGQHASMHLHLWKQDERKKGTGLQFLKLSIPVFFDTLMLEDLYCEPYALNPAPNKAMERLGFTLVKEYNTIPGSFNFEQPVKKWHLSKAEFKRLWEMK